MGDSRDPRELAIALAEVARRLVSEPSLQATLDRIVVCAIDLVEGCEVAGIMAIANHKVHTLAASDEKVRISDRMQGDVGEGPCFDAVRSGEEVFRIADTRAAAPGWPRYAPCAEKLGIRSILGFKLFTGEETLGALNLYSTQPRAFTARSEETGWLLASHSAVALASARSEAHLQAEIPVRQGVGEAIGMLMERHGLSEDEAFAALAKAAREQNIKVSQVARYVIEAAR
ncbi:GAF and ANTAR domain-containing protein [Actinoallomurus sp. NBC_01490]|jgi:GAF domain-containing protein|uniref:GAF and ANTAR domain-containing protein n=1 Tax=Actinoallomurus sp. NBC_01490 TaxID=2903557 RepID=UPI002E364FCC|nr:GAF and ANTAR domain-containing protein [Actinoallomurus sp. NBC_01490]